VWIVVACVFVIGILILIIYCVVKCKGSSVRVEMAVPKSAVAPKAKPAALQSVVSTRGSARPAADVEMATRPRVPKALPGPSPLSVGEKVTKKKN